MTTCKTTKVTKTYISPDSLYLGDEYGSVSGWEIIDCVKGQDRVSEKTTGQDTRISTLESRVLKLESRVLKLESRLSNNSSFDVVIGIGLCALVLLEFYHIVRPLI